MSHLLTTCLSLSLPPPLSGPEQSVIFNVQPHPSYPDFYQCVTFGFFDNNNGGEMTYTVFCISFLYFIPLSIIIIAYTRIIIEISRKSRDTQSKYSEEGGESRCWEG